MASFFYQKLMQRYLTSLLLIVILALAFFCYSPGFEGSFTFDDNINIIDNSAIQINTLDYSSLKAAAFSISNGLSARPLSMASFALNYYFGGASAYSFKLLNFFIHLLNAISLFFLTKLILKAYYQRDPIHNDEHFVNWIGISTAAIWVLHPMNLTSVLYVVQRMTSLSVFFVLLGLIAYIYGRQQHQKSKWLWILSSFVLFTPLAVLSKENGALLPLYLLLIELFFFNFKTTFPRERNILICIFFAIVCIPLLLLMGYTIYNPAWITGGYAIRDFTLGERLMTEARILWFYTRLIFVPDITAMGLYHDDIGLSHSLLKPLTTLPAAFGILAVAIAAIIMRKKHPMAAFGVCFYLLGHSIESTVIPLELVHEHRNYLPMYGLLLAASFYLFSSAPKLISHKYKITVALTLILTLSSLTTIRASQWGDLYTFHFMEAAHHPESLRANTDLAYIYAFLPSFSMAEAEEHFTMAMDHYHKAYELSPKDSSGLLGLVGLSAQRNRAINKWWLDDLQYRLSHFPFSPNYVNSLMSLEKCVTQGSCKSFPSESMDQLLEAALSNPTLYSTARSNILFSRSHLLLVGLDKPKEARNTAFMAAKLMPSDIGSQITFLKVLINLHEYQKAKQQLQIVKRQRPDERYASELHQLEQILTEPDSL